MNSSQIALKFGFLPYKRVLGERKKPHFSIRVEDVDFHIDSTPGAGFNLITHAHSDHYGQKNLENSSAIASDETAKILEVVSEKSFSGIRFKIGETIKLGDFKIKTFPTFHIYGASAFYFPNLDLLITGDVKSWKKLPKCKVLITEATYSHPSNVFEDEIELLLEKAMEGHCLGAYPIGKAQRVAKILNHEGIEFCADEKIANICKALGIEVGNGGAKITSPSKLKKGYILTAQKYYKLPRITISDHLDYRGLLEMIEHCKPEHVIFYHGKVSKAMIEKLKEMDITASTIDDIDVFLEAKV
ncbi:MAG: MBL fold metallo-hydrolase RNA specificity domain-containing protein [Archaeoglobaceae archaeon]